MKRAHSWGSVLCNCKQVTGLEHTDYEPLANCKLWWLCWRHSSSIYSHSFLLHWLASQLFAVACAFCFPPLCCACWWSQPGVQAPMVLSSCLAANVESTCPSAFCSHLVFELFLLFWGFLLLLAGNPPAKMVLGKPGSPVSVQLCTGHKERNGTKPSCWTSNFCETPGLCLRLWRQKTKRTITVGWLGRTPISLLHWQPP